MRRWMKIALAAAVVVLVVGGFGVWYFVFRDTAAPVASLAAVEGSGSDAASGGSPITNPDGTWTLVTGDNIFVGYRIQELFGGDTVKRTATGRTPAVSGSLTVQGNQITAVDITADVQQLKSDDSRRDSTQKAAGLDTNTFGTARFVLTEPITLSGPPAEGASIDVQATGQLTLHGVTKPVTIPLQASVKDGRINVAGGAGVVLADYGISPPRTGFVNVDDNGAFEVQLAFVKS
jgi:polyisoprenoid-binding protein YceI